ncbi:A/G-specific adenine glycosylase [Candidatus Parcubacteria bacterium]|nr:A/G-specific adenine glycosylase [Candidatus Parcubacteria bacterium]
MTKQPSIKATVSDLKKFYKKSARHSLPWRKTRDPYRILVSEMMLQQTQVSRVIPFYKKFIKKFPTAKILAHVPLKVVLKEWNGLGYNRRAKYLHEASKILAKEKYIGQRLPGVGPYTSRAVLAFAYNKPEVFVETNIRTVIFHSQILKNIGMVSDTQLLPLVEEMLKTSKMQPREFYAAMMDYGSHLKQQGVRLNSQSKHYTKQSTFKGSARELRGAIMRELLHHHATVSYLLHKIPRTKEEITHELTRLAAEGLVKLQGKYFEIPV